MAVSISLFVYINYNTLVVEKSKLVVAGLPHTQGSQRNFHWEFSNCKRSLETHDSFDVL